MTWMGRPCPRLGMHPVTYARGSNLKKKCQIAHHHLSPRDSGSAKSKWAQRCTVTQAWPTGRSHPPITSEHATQASAIAVSSWTSTVAGKEMCSFHWGGP